MDLIVEEDQYGYLFHYGRWFHCISADARDVKVLSVVVDFSSTTNAANDVFQCIELPLQVVTAGIEVMTADTAGNSGTVSLVTVMMLTVTFRLKPLQT